MAALSSTPGAGPSRSPAYPISPLQVGAGAAVAALQVVQAARQSVEYDIAEYEVLLNKLDQLETHGNEAIESIAELGAGIWINTRISDTRHITLDLGLGIHLDLPIDDAKTYTIKKLEVLKKKRDTLVRREAQLHSIWQFEQNSRHSQ